MVKVGVVSSAYYDFTMKHLLGTSTVIGRQNSKNIRIEIADEVMEV